MKAIITADWHLSELKPRCRLDEDWLLTQEKHLDFVAKTANKYKCPICIVGDIFDKAIVPDKIKIMFLQFVDKVKYGVYILAGNHCLPYHSWSNVNNSSFGVIWNSAKVKGLNELGEAAHFGEDISGIDNGLLFIHQLTFKTVNDIPPNTQAKTALDLLEEYPNKKYIFVGDNHHSFHFIYKKRHVINPGCFNRQASDFINYQPIIYFVDTDNDTVEEINIPDNDLMVTDEYIQEVNERNDRIEAFIEGIKKNGHISLDFLSNLEEALNKNDLDKDTIKVIRELCYEEE